MAKLFFDFFCNWGLSSQKSVARLEKVCLELGNMNTKYVVGQRILKVKQGKVKRKGLEPCNAVQEIELENGVKIVPIVLESNAVDFTVNVEGIKTLKEGA